MYKGGDIVNFSIFCVDAETKPFNPKAGSVNIYNPEDLKIKSFADVAFKKGKFKGSFELSDNTAKGEWRAKFEADGQVNTIKMLLTCF